MQGVVAQRSESFALDGSSVSDLEKFRLEVRDWLEQNAPQSVRKPITFTYLGGTKSTIPDPNFKLWVERLAAKGWTVPDWPTQYGGAGFTSEQKQILLSEMRRIGARPPMMSIGAQMIGPLLLMMGSDEQKATHLPKIASGELAWCQGYSEPNAGSDLASVQTRAVRDGDDLILNGQKVWTSYADRSDWMFLIVRTNPDVPKWAGITFLLLDMSSPGVATRPIELISGSSHFCETFFENVRVPLKNVVGEIDAGWDVAKRLLLFERQFITEVRSFDSEDKGGELLVNLARKHIGPTTGPIADASIRQRIAQFGMDNICSDLTMKRTEQAIKAGKMPGGEVMIFKLVASELEQRRCELQVDIAGVYGCGWDGEGFEKTEIANTREWLRAAAMSIEGGTSEINLNIIAKRVLGLPD